jgi:hypothetical protein
MFVNEGCPFEFLAVQAALALSLAPQAKRPPRAVSAWSTNKASLEQLVRYTDRPAVSE